MRMNEKAFSYEHILEDNFVIEKEMETPFEDCYRKAVKLVEQLLEENQKVGERKTENEDPDVRMHNVISFIGRRGTGKTSAMFSFRNMIAPREDAELYSELRKKLISEHSRLSKCKFITLRYINAEFLQESEDVVEILLARMQNYLTEAAQQHTHLRTREEELRQLYWKFDTIFKHLRFLKTDTRKPIESGESALRVLKGLASSHSVELEFRALVRDYLCFFSHGDQPCFLVIVVDDVDLYPSEKKDAYDLLNSIYEFLMIPGIIILMSYDEDKIKHICKNHFNSRKAFQNMDSISMEISQQFLQKMIPTNQRIYLPNYENIDLAGADDPRAILRIRLPLGKQTELFGSGVSPEVCFGSKELILRLIAQRTGIYFDMVGKKKHFLEERNLRELHDFLKILVNLSPVPIDSPSKEDVLADNRLWLKEYLYNSFVPRTLTADETTLFRGWVVYPVFRRSQEILNEIRERISDLEGLGETQYQEAIRYSYGELAHNIYLSSRLVYSPVEMRFQDAPFSKSLVHCIIFMYSVVLSEYYADCRNAASNEEKEAAKAEFLRLIGPSIAGQWVNEMFPFAVITDGNKNRIEVVPSKLASSKLDPCKIGSVIISDLTTVWRIPLEDSNGMTLHDALVERKRLESFLIYIIRRAEWSGMFFTHIRYHGNPFQMPDSYCFTIEEEDEFEKGRNRYVLKVPQIPNGSTSACFNILNFCVNSFRWDSYFPSLHKALKGAFAEKLSEFKLSKIEIREFSKTFDKAAGKTMYSEYKKWSKTFGDMAFPLQNYDMSYNILKRLAERGQNEMAEENLRIPSPELKQNDEEKWRNMGVNCWKYYQHFLKNIADALDQQDKSYELDGTFRTTFRECPFVKTVFQSQEDTWKVEDIVQMFYAVGTIAANTAQTNRVTKL